MNYPSFFDAAPRITLYDPLSAFLGATEDGLVEYTYLDAVKLAGHSCPTVAGAYLMTRRALRHLYQGEIPVRGDIDVTLSQDASEGVAGVVAAVATLVTGAAGEGGFKGIAGRFERRDRLAFGAAIAGEIRFTRRDTGEGVIASLNSAAVPLHADARPLFQRVLGGEASPAEAQEFRRLWQERVRQLLDHADDPEVVLLTPAVGPASASAA
ncbi:FmdE family protein [Microvirga sp. G4-2]|uniref:FmdE family protein n=1 Tax=Microvirga sp. G4-2 TaxID=3434467 RepID=UPI0040451520